MKGQDILMLLKLTCLQKRESDHPPPFPKTNWTDWENPYLETPENMEPAALNVEYSVRSLANSTGISKSEISLSLQRSLNTGLVRRDLDLQIHRVNSKALLEFIIYGLKYVFPAKYGTVSRGIATSFGAPVLKDKLMSAGDLVPVWSDTQGNTKGQSIEPLFKSVTYAVRRDSELYSLLALVDAIRIGLPRERNIAIDLLRKRIEV